jgi:hypothetical protein
LPIEPDRPYGRSYQEPPPPPPPPPPEKPPPENPPPPDELRGVETDAICDDARSVIEAIEFANAMRSHGPMPTYQGFASWKSASVSVLNALAQRSTTPKLIA